MKRWQIFALTNGVCLACSVGSMFVAPGETPVWKWGVVVGAIILAVNWVLLVQLRKKKLSSIAAPEAKLQKAKPSGGALWLFLGLVGLYQFLEGGFSRVLVVTEVGIFIVCGGLVWLAKKIAEGYRE